MALYTNNVSLKSYIVHGLVLKKLFKNFLIRCTEYNTPKTGSDRWYILSD